ncbi:MAG: hypothetical protein V4675_03565 [Verrucomicrobiota bacterium]
MNLPEKAKFLYEMRGLTISNEDTYIRVYPSFIRYFSLLDKITANDFVIAANFVYGWMPTILDLSGTDDDWSKAANILTLAKINRLRSHSELKFLAGLVNNSIVGVSKILHFLNPSEHAIWDSRVYRYLMNSTGHHYQVNSARNYLRYQEICDEMSHWPEVTAVTAAISAKTGYQITPLRAIEITMFIHGGKPASMPNSVQIQSATTDI